MRRRPDFFIKQITLQTSLINKMRRRPGLTEKDATTPHFSQTCSP